MFLVFSFAKLKNLFFFFIFISVFPSMRTHPYMNMDENLLTILHDHYE